MSWLFAVATFSTLFRTAVNAYTLQVGYPLWRWVGFPEFAALHREYLRRLHWVITVPHVVMFFSTAALAVRHPAWLAGWSAWLVAGLAWTVVGISALVAGPVHERFSRQGETDDAGMVRLMQISVARTLMMLLASGLLCRAMISGLERGAGPL